MALRLAARGKRRCRAAEPRVGHDAHRETRLERGEVGGLRVDERPRDRRAPTSSVARRRPRDRQAGSAADWGWIGRHPARRSGASRRRHSAATCGRCSRAAARTGDDAPAPAWRRDRRARRRSRAAGIGRCARRSGCSRARPRAARRRTCRVVRRRLFPRSPTPASRRDCPRPGCRCCRRGRRTGLMVCAQSPANSTRPAAKGLEALAAIGPRARPDDAAARRRGRTGGAGARESTSLVRLAGCGRDRVDSRGARRRPRARVATPRGRR